MTWAEEGKKRPADQARSILGSVSAFFTEDHIVLTSGKHASAYVNHDPLFEHMNASLLSELASVLAKAAEAHPAYTMGKMCVVGPETGGWHLGHWMTYHHNLGKSPAQQLLAVCAYKQAQGFFFNDDTVQFLKGRSCLIVDDVLTTGKSVRATMQALTEVGATPAGVLVVCDRSGTEDHTSMGLPVTRSLFQLDAQSWEAKDCPMCKAGKPINQRVGHPEKFSKP